MTNLTDATFERAIEVLKSNSSKWGIKASASYYNQVWARDAFISFLGSNMLEDVLLLGTCRKAINTLAKTRSPLGQIADFYNPDEERAEFGFSGATDSSSWSVSKVSSRPARRNSPAVCVSASRSPERWLSNPRCCCSTSPSARSTR